MQDSNNLQAYLYTLSTPSQDCTMHFGSDHERFCIDTGASACISDRKENFIKLQPVDNIKINGVGRGLPVEGVGTLKWPNRDNNQNELDIYVHNAMGLLCPQQLAMQTQRPGHGFHALGHAGVLTVAGFSRTIPYDPRSCLPILHSIDRAQCYLASGQGEHKRV
jgi:hypothetical protein